LRCFRGCRAGGPPTDSAEARALPRRVRDLREQRVGSELQQVAGSADGSAAAGLRDVESHGGVGGENHVRACFP
jgi:hypothetical protein